MQEIKIPDGHKATILGGTIRIEPIKEVQDFKDGDAIVFIGKTSGYKHIVFYDKEKMFGNKTLYGITPLHNKRFCQIGYSLEFFKKATIDERMLLLESVSNLAKKGKYWDAEALEVKDLIKVPESIGIYKHKHRLDLGLFIGFNNNSQFLGFHPFNKQFIVTSEIYKYEKIQCYLQPCKREDLKEGDTAFFSSTFRLAEDITSDLGRYVKVIGKYNYKANKSGEIVQERNHAEWWYKLIPINN